MASKSNIKIPKSLWTAQDTLRLAQNVLASIKLRTSKGMDANGKPFKAYSTNPLFVAYRGARLAPKGGEPTQGGVFYEGGYRQYKHESRRRGGGRDSAEVDLVLSGNMMNNLVVKKATQDMFIIGLTEHAQYGYFVNQDREFLGLNEKDIDVITKAVETEIKGKLNK